MSKMDHIRYNDLYSRIKEDRDWFDEIIQMCKKLYEREPCGGALHNVLDDQNIEDGHVTWCAGFACGKEDDEADDIANLMRAMTIKQRERVVGAYDLYSQYES